MLLKVNRELRFTIHHEVIKRLKLTKGKILKWKFRKGNES